MGVLATSREILKLWSLWGGEVSDEIQEDKECRKEMQGEDIPGRGKSNAPEP